MALHASAVEILIEKSRFEPEVALGIAEAIEASVNHAQFVTVPTLDGRLQKLTFEVDRKFDELKADIDRRFSDFELKVERRFAELESKIDRGLAELEMKMERRFAEVDLKFGQLETRMESIKAELVRWVFLVMLGNVALTAGVTAILNSIRH